MSSTPPARTEQHAQPQEEQQQQQQVPRRFRAVELVPPAEMVAAMRPGEDGGLHAPPGPPAIAVAGGGGGAHQPLPHRLRARLAHEAPQRGAPPGRGEDPHAPRHLPVAQAQPLAPVVQESGGAQDALIESADADVAAAHGRGKQGREQHAAREAGGAAAAHRGKRVQDAAVGPAARGV